MAWKFLNRFKPKSEKTRAKAGKPGVSEEQGILERALKNRPFIQACEKKGVNPRIAFLNAHAKMMKSQSVAQLEFTRQMEAQKAGKKFDKAAFYIQIATTIVENI